ncbi:hypothetical protein SAMN05216257_104100 [Meinhardsimonia xiamenensis]|jgi:hypothetical protein|uniref:Uncharacterized protein n=1 Tax=Meinhardsimonia xiamenensis TaxID=990712 RepID=A0A1G9E0L7_9RHOB|nr:hypothetical protein LV81_02963 [Meinhardsimonia xiamenensis]SDK69628.1 hypothetical protein SAMN05216257_104100 [Meinhardsimonia xiamenensis]
MHPNQARELHRQASDKEAYGITNTGPAWNRLQESRRRRMHPALRRLAECLDLLTDAALLVLGWGAALAPLLLLLLP